MTYASLAGAVLITIAGILTPIGLGETIVAGSLTSATFQYAKDRTPFGIETPLRDNYILTRFCANRHRPCPGVNVSDIVGFHSERSNWINGTVSYRNLTVYDSYVAENITDCALMESGISGQTRSRFNTDNTTPIRTQTNFTRVRMEI